MPVATLETDVAVVGAGGCGLTAALAAAESGRRVLLLERGPAVGGSTHLSAGIFVAAGGRSQRTNGEMGTADELAADIYGLNHRQSDPQVTLALCRASGLLMDWLQERGAPLEHVPDYRYPGMSRAWIYSPPPRHGAVITDALLRQVQDRPEIDLRLSTAATGLAASGEAVTGLRARGPDGRPLRVRARAVILAASGFAANADMVARFIPDMAGAAYFGAPGATGEAIAWARGLGATVAHMGAFQAHSSIAWPRPMLVTTYLINHGAIQVNRDGRRFGDETDSYAGHAIAVQRQPGRTVVELFDERIRQQTLANYPRFAECIAAGLVQRAETVAGLAHLFDLPPRNLAGTLANYEAAIHAGGDEFGRTHFGAPLEPPYYGIRVTSALVQTLGGLKVDGHGRVLRPDERPVPGLFAGGGTAAGLAGDRPAGYLAGTGLLAALGLGWLAGRATAQL